MTSGETGLELLDAHERGEHDAEPDPKCPLCARDTSRAQLAGRVAP